MVSVSNSQSWRAHVTVTSQSMEPSLQENLDMLNKDGGGQYIWMRGVVGWLLRVLTSRLGSGRGSTIAQPNPIG